VLDQGSVVFHAAKVNLLHHRVYGQNPNDPSRPLRRLQVAFVELKDCSKLHGEWNRCRTKTAA
jgi:hypothetical protein